MFAIYVTFIADGYADAERPVTYAPGDMRQEGTAYWYSLRHAEVTCPRCDPDEPDDECHACGGSGVAEGEGFEVWRYLFDTEEAADEVYARIMDAGDGYERAAVVLPLTGTLVVEWEPDYRETTIPDLT